MNKNLKYSIFGVLFIVLIFFIYFCLGLFGQYFWLNGAEKIRFNNYNQNFEQTYSKTQTAENLFALFKQRMINKDKEGVKVMTVPMFGTYPQEMKDRAFEDFYNFYVKYDFTNVKFDYYEESREVLVNNLSYNNKIFSHKISVNYDDLSHLKYKINKFPIQGYYTLVTGISQER